MNYLGIKMTQMTTIAGNPYEEVGPTEAYLVLNTKGKLKIRIGNTFIDLLDDNGKINKDLL